MNKIYLMIYNKEKRFTYTKYFSTIKEKNKYIERIKYVKSLMIIEDSEDLVYYG